MAKRLACALMLAVLTVPAGGAEAAEWSRDRDVPGTSGLGFPFDADVGDRGRVAVAVVRDGVRVIVRAPGGRWGAAERLSPARAGATAPQVEMTGRGEVIAAWTQSTSRRQPVSGPNAIRVAVRSRAGRWHVQTVGGTRHFIAAEPRLAVNARGDAAVIWRGWHRRGGRDRLLVAFRPAGRRFGRAASMGEAGSTSRWRSIAAGACTRRGRARCRHSTCGPGCASRRGRPAPGRGR